MSDTQSLTPNTGHHVSSLILTLRSTPVLVDADLATLYGVTTKALNQKKKKGLVTNCDQFKNYVDDRVLEQLIKRAAGVSATILCKEVSRSLQNDLVRHNAQYLATKAIEFSLSHDRVKDLLKSHNA